MLPLQSRIPANTSLRSDIYWTNSDVKDWENYKIYEHWEVGQIADLAIVSLLSLQSSMRSHVSDGCSVVEGDLSSHWTGGGMLLEQLVLWFRVRWCLGHLGQQRPSSHNASEEPLPQWLLGHTHVRGEVFQSYCSCSSVSSSDRKKHKGVLNGCFMKILLLFWQFILHFGMSNFLQEQFHPKVNVLA